MANSSMKALDRARQSVLVKQKADDRMNSERAGDVLVHRSETRGQRSDFFAKSFPGFTVSDL
jgi:hypothetical protein